MSIESHRQQALYNQWANERLCASLRKLDDSARKSKRNMFAESLEGLLHHLLITDGLTMATLTNDMMGFRPRDSFGQEILIESMVQSLYPDFDDFTRMRRHLDRQIVDYAATLQDEELTEPLSYFDANGERHKLLRWQLLTELGTHQVHHRGQASAVLFGLGQSLGNLDYTAFLAQASNGRTNVSTIGTRHG